MKTKQKSLTKHFIENTKKRERNLERDYNKIVDNLFNKRKKQGREI